MVTKSFNNFEGGYTREQALCARFVQMVEGFAMLRYFQRRMRVMAFALVLEYSIRNHYDKAIYNLHEYETTSDRYLLAHTGDTVQELNEKPKDLDGFEEWAYYFCYYR